MQRIKHNYQFNLIRGAIELLPEKVKPYLDQVDFVVDYNPYWLGYNPPKAIKDGRSYLNTCHCVWSWNTPDNKPVIFLYSENLRLYDNPSEVIWHEIGHAIHEQLDLFTCDWIGITNYEKQDWDWWGCECFACSFERWLFKDRQVDDWENNQEMQRKYDKRPIEFFNNLFGKLN